MKPIIKSFSLLAYSIAMVVAAILIGCTTKKKEEENNPMNILQNKPLFEINIKSFGAGYGVLINGIYIQTQFDPETTEDLTIPINHFFTSGRNSIGMKVVPDEPGIEFNSSAYIEFTLTVKAYREDKAHSLLTMKFDGSTPPKIQEKQPESIYLTTEPPFSPATSGAIEISGTDISAMEDFAGGLEITREIIIPSSLPRWKFFDSDKLPLPTSLSKLEWDEMRDNLFEEYKTIHNALKSKNVDAILPLFEERSSEIDLAFYEPPGTTQKQLQETLIDTLSDDELEIAPINPDAVGFAYTENINLRELARADQGAALAYQYQDGGSRGFPIIFRRENGKWIITR